MYSNKNFDVFLYTAEKTFRFFLNKKKELYYSEYPSENPIFLYPNNVMEFDIDIDNQGNIGIIVLDKDGKLVYKYFDGSTWGNHLLYKLNLNLEEFRHVSIKFSLGSPYIIVCWRSLSSPNLWSIISYYLKQDNWEKKIFNRVFYKEDIQPYFIVRDDDFNLYLVYLNNYNMFYNIIFTQFLSLEKRWIDRIRISDCLYLKFHQLDMLLDSNGFIHISWIDKHKKNYCVKYLFFDFKTMEYSKTECLIEDSLPIIRQHLLFKKGIIHCYVLTSQGFFCTKRSANMNWNLQQIPKIDVNYIPLIKLLQIFKHSSLQYLANYVFCEKESSFLPIFIPETNSEANIHTKGTENLRFLNNKVEKETRNLHVNTIEETKIQQYKIKQELQSENQLRRSFQEQNVFLNKEIERLKEQNKKYLEIIHKNSERNKNYEDELDELKHKNKEILSQIQLYKSELEIKKQHIDMLQNKNVSLCNQIEKNKIKNLLKRWFFSSNKKPT